MCRMFCIPGQVRLWSELTEWESAGQTTLVIWEKCHFSRTPGYRAMNSEWKFLRWAPEFRHSKPEIVAPLNLT